MTKRTERFRVAVLALGAVAALLLGGCGGTPVPVTVAADPAAAGDVAVAGDPGSATADEPLLPDPTAKPSAEPTRVDPPETEVAAAPTVTTRTVTETRVVGFATRTVEDDELDEGVRKTRTKGVTGVRTLTYRVTFAGGKQTAKKLVTDVVTRKPVTKVVAVGTKTAGDDGCDPNYTPCVPVAADVDCSGGGGNGPEYVDGPVTVTGDDVYDLDRDGDGVGCDG